MRGGNTVVDAEIDDLLSVAGTAAHTDDGAAQ